MKTLKEILPRTVIVLAVMAIAVAVAGILTGCAGTKKEKPSVTAYNYFSFEPNSNANVQSGTQGSQANAIHAPVNGPEVADKQAAEGEQAPQQLSDKQQQKSIQQASLFGNNATGDRATDVAASNMIELLRNVRGSSAGQSGALTRGDDSPADSQQSQTPTQTENRNKTLNVPVSVSQQGAVAQTGTTPTAAEQAIPAVFELAIKQAKSPVTAAQKAAVDSAVAADTDNAVPAGLNMTLAEWRTLKAAYIECPECLGGLTDAELAALKAATGK